MRIVHTSDWHAGRVWYGQRRYDELRAVLDHLAEFVLNENVDLLLMSGDVFDNGMPSAAAERLVFRALKRIGQAGIPSVVIAGNHDSPKRLEAWGLLADLIGCHVVPHPAPPDRGGLREIVTPCGETALVAALPFAQVRHIVAAVQLVEGEQMAYETYSGWMQSLFEVYAERFRADTVNLVMAHAFVENAVLAHSERRVHVGEQWAIKPQSLPSNAQYVALGHIHKPQQLENAPQARYAGSPLQLDFGEVGEEKSFVVVDVEPGVPARTTLVPYEGGKPLIDLRATFAELEADAEKLRDAGWLRVTVPLEVPEPDLNSRVRRLIPNALSVRVELPELEADEDPDRPPANASATELFTAFYRKKHQRPPEDALVDLFAEIYRECGGGAGGAD